jgi:hypothetical protein
MAQQTAVEWFAERLTLNGLADYLTEEDYSLYKELKQQAKEVEKQQHSETWHDSRENTCIPFEDYYTQTYKSE